MSRHMDVCQPAMQTQTQPRVLVAAPYFRKETETFGLPIGLSHSVLNFVNIRCPGVKTHAFRSSLRSGCCLAPWDVTEHVGDAREGAATRRQEICHSSRGASVSRSALQRHAQESMQLQSGQLKRSLLPVRPGTTPGHIRRRYAVYERSGLQALGGEGPPIVISLRGLRPLLSQQPLSALSNLLALCRLVQVCLPHELIGCEDPKDASACFRTLSSLAQFQKYDAMVVVDAGYMVAG
eukprot:scaffold374_cov380-Prasinococcus_capsulatus_cf.AAC.13